MKETMKPEFPLRLDLQFFAEGDPETKTDETPTTPEGAKEPKTFTQEELDEIVAKRVSREQKKLEKFSDYDVLKQELETFRSEKEKQELNKLGEVEKAQKLVEAEKERAATLEQNYNALTEKVRKQAVLMAFTEEARKSNIEYINDAFKLAEADLSAVEVDENYNVSGIGKIVEKLVADKPFLVKSAPKVDKDIGNPSNPKPEADKTKEQLLEDARMKALRTGRPEDRVAYANLKAELAK